MTTQEVLNILNTRIFGIEIDTVHFSGNNVKYHEEEVLYQIKDIITEVFKELKIKADIDYISRLAIKYFDKMMISIKKEIKVLKKTIRDAYDNGNYKLVLDLISGLSNTVFYVTKYNGKISITDEAGNRKAIKDIPNWKRMLAQWESEHDVSYFYDKYDFSGDRTIEEKHITTNINKIAEAVYEGEYITLYKIP